MRSTQTIGAALIAFGAVTGAGQFGNSQPPTVMPAHDARLHLRQETLSSPEPLPAVDRGPRVAIRLAPLAESALRNNPSLARAGARVDAARGRWYQAGRRRNPTVGYFAEEVGNEGSAGLQGAFVNQEFVRGSKLALSQAAAEREILLAEREFDAMRYRVLTDVRIEFYEGLAAERTIEFAEELAAFAEEAAETSQRLFEGNQVSRFEPLQARIEAQTARILAESARQRKEAALKSLTYAFGAREVNEVFGTQDAARLDFEGSLDEGLRIPEERVPGCEFPKLRELSFDELVSSLLAQSPEIGAALADVDRASWALRRAQVEPTPNVAVQAGVGVDTATDDAFANVQVSIPLPVHDRNEGAIAAAGAELRAARSNVARIDLQLRDRLARALEAYAAARFRAETYECQILPAAGTSRDLARLGYAEEELDYLSVLTAQRQFAQANLEYINALRELQVRAALIDGLLLSGSLEDQNLSSPSDR